ncbi:myotubularin-related protein 11 [Rhinophrynus dorsalis]
MLPRPMTSFTLKQNPRDNMLRSSKSSKINHCTAPIAALKCLPGETVHDEAIKVKKRLQFKDGDQYVLGTLYCTNYRVAFRPELLHPSPDLSSGVLFDNDNDVPLPCIDRILAVSSQTKVKVLTAQSNLKFIPEELLIYYKGFRLMHLHFSDNGLQPQAYKITRTILHYQQKSCMEIQKRNPARRSLAMCNVVTDNGQGGSLMDFPTQLFESCGDWEREIERLGATAWRVSPVNERCDTSISLSKYIVVPCKLLDNDLKKTFAHFNQRRIPRWSWHHPAGSDLLRSARFETSTDPDRDDVRFIRSLLFANHSQCVIVDTSDELPAVSDIQLSFVKLRGLCLSDPSVPVSDEKWLSNLESTRWLDHVRSCLKKASEVSVLLSERICSVVLQESEDWDMNCLMSSLVQLMSDPHSRTLSGFQSLIQKEWVSAGHPFLQRINLFKETDKDESQVFLLFLDCVWQLIQQFPSAFEFTESYLIALHDSAFNPFCSSFTHNCQWDRIRGNQRHSFSQTYTPVNGWRDVVREKILLNGDYKHAVLDDPVPATVWEWGLFYSDLHRQQFRNPMYQNKEHPVLNGNGIYEKPSKLDLSSQNNVYLLSKGTLILQSPLLPWKSGTVSKKGARRAQSSESLLEEERQLRSNVGSHYTTAELLLPLCMGPWVRLWKRCYLRCAVELQLNMPPPSATGLATELKFLQEKLANQSINWVQEHSSCITHQTGSFSP